MATSAPLRIIVADDNPDTVATLCALLESEGHIVRAFTSGEAIVEAVAQFHPDACIFDIDMPGESGYAIAGGLDRAYGGARPVLIAISGKWCRASDQLLALSCGFDHFLEKPAAPAEVFHLLNALQRRRAEAARQLA